MLNQFMRKRNGLSVRFVTIYSCNQKSSILSVWFMRVRNHSNVTFVNTDLLENFMGQLLHTFFGLASLTQFFTVWKIGKDVSNLWISCRHGFSLEQCRHASGVIIADPSYQYGVQAVKVAAKVPKSGFFAKSTVH